MSDKSKKRSRKSKLVPRDCIVEYEDDVDMQIPVTKIFKGNKYLKKENIKNTPKTRAATVNTDICKRILPETPTAAAVVPSSPMKFQIKVEVETCDDYNLHITPNETRTIKEDSTESTVKPDEESDLEIPRPIKIEPFTEIKSVNTIKLDEIYKQNITVRAKILSATREIVKNSTNIADKILDLCVRNTIGQEIKIKLKENKHEKKIQNVLELWRNWQTINFHREAPLFYKCYICNMSWWNLSEFRDHISKHTYLTISLESYEKHESNIVAYAPNNKSKQSLIEIPTEGDCMRCGKDFNYHKLSSRLFQKYYNINQKCERNFFTCTGLMNHIRSCSNCRQDIRNKNFRCNICKNVFGTPALLDKHFIVCHTVRSDVVIQVNYQNCEECGTPYMIENLHDCEKKLREKFNCSYCYRSFCYDKVLERHMESSIYSYTCEICSSYLLWSCKKFEHMLGHTNNYIMVYKCIKCLDFNVFLSREAALAHGGNKHDSNFDDRDKYFVKIIIPKSCYPNIEDADPDPGPLIVPKTETEQEMTSESINMYEHIKIKEEPHDLPDPEQLTVKEEPIGYDDQTEDYSIQDYGHMKEENVPAASHLEPELTIKEEYEEFEIEEYEDDIIKLDIDINEHLFLVKQESNETQESELSQESLDTTAGSVKSQMNDNVNVKKKTLTVKSLRNKKKMYTCTKCGFTAKHRDYRMHIETECPRICKPKLFVCTKCNNEFSSMKKYLTHFVDHGYKLLCCPECLTQFYRFTKLTAHIQVHIKQNFVRIKSITLEGSRQISDYQCKKCSAVVKIGQFFEHWELHVNETPAKPPKLPKLEKPQTVYVPTEFQFDAIGETIRLLQLEKTDRICNHCGREFKRQYECKRHLIEHLLSHAFSLRPEYNELRCQICQQGFHNQEKYKQHMRDHASLPVYKCELCDKCFSDSSNFTKHKKVHNLKVFVCDLCGKKFQLKITLEKHMELHKTANPIKCTPCDKVFYFQTCYRRHMRYCHERHSFGFRCMVCKTRFKTLKEKWEHMWEIHKERKHKADCPICFKSFRKYQEVRSHAKLEHNTDVSMYSVKNAGSMRDIKQFLKSNPTFKLGTTETLVVLE